LNLDTEQAARLGAFLQLVKQYAPVLNLTAFQGVAEMRRELVDESLRLLELGPVQEGWNCVDLGSGVGTPVIPLALACPQARFTAVEARAKRVTFLRQVAAQLQLTNLRVLEQRTEQLLAEEDEEFDLVTARAYAAPDVLCAHAAALLRQGGELRGYAGAQMGEVERAASAHGFTAKQVIVYSVGASQRHAYRLRKGV
jgi:16S rRNA (guanine527-N7)-methyltransferase